jgi:hypothetical protein
MTFKLATFLLFILTARVDRADSQACAFCADGTDGTGEQGSRRFVGDESTFTCSELTDQWSQLDALESDSDCKDLQLYAFQIGCCQTPPYGYCDICPDGSDFERGNEVDVGDATNPTCAQLELLPFALVGVSEPGTCEDTLLRRSAVYCGCPNVQQDCSLCPGGSEVGNSRREDKWFSENDCGGNQYLFSTFTAEECTSSPALFGVDLAAFCLCPDYPPPEVVCELCPGGEVENPDFVYDGSSTDATCGQLEKFAAFTTRTDLCDSILAPAKEGCKCRNSDSSDKGFVVSLVVAGAMAIPAIL